ncbi:MAG TPA: anti-sigma factor [Candidatus Omnitrophota bacterium]|nr:anti-sigma factor [Candidatus Omnitrophota bacterium]HPD84384.1 anti-sigma factor [Candidatus Omnitrophota bacterium]HRZ03242.1 anti-sigma factor [Candidatus Omnitrophota bacterium]
MQCKKIQEWLKSDHLDGECSPKEQKQINEHLAKCAPCRRLEKELQAQRVVFNQAKQLQPPEYIWNNIREAIAAENLENTDCVRSGIIERLRELILKPRPVFVLSSALTTVILITVLTSAVIHKKQLASQENGREILAEYGLNGDSEALLLGLGTSIEEYFL